MPAVTTPLALWPSRPPRPLQAQVPRALLRRYDVYFRPRSKMVNTSLRGVTSVHIGCLVRIRVSRCHASVVVGVGVGRCGTAVALRAVLFSARLRHTCHTHHTCVTPRTRRSGMHAPHQVRAPACPGCPGPPWPTTPSTPARAPARPGCPGPPGPTPPSTPAPSTPACAHSGHRDARDRREAAH
eukprot:356388-Chlamydomonas_euryale.AAC.8